MDIQRIEKQVDELEGNLEQLRLELIQTKEARAALYAGNVEFACKNLGLLSMLLIHTRNYIIIKSKQEG